MKSFSVENTYRNKHDTVWLNINHAYHLSSASSVCAEEEFSADRRQNNNSRNMECDGEQNGSIVEQACA